MCISVPGKHFDVLASEAAITIGPTLAVVAVLVWLIVRQRLTAVRRVAVATVLALTGLLSYRDVLDDPLTALFSLAGVSATLLVGLLWRMLTDNGYSHGDSTRIPRASRVLISLASTTYAVTLIATVALACGRWEFDIRLVEYSGDATLGLSLALAAFFAGLSLAARGRLVRPGEPRDGRGRFQPSA